MADPTDRLRERRPGDSGPALSGFTAAYARNPEPWARPGPPPKPPLPLKFTCRKCGAEVPPSAGSCATCGHLFYWH